MVRQQVGRYTFARAAVSLFAQEWMVMMVSVSAVEEEEID